MPAHAVIELRDVDIAQDGQHLVRTLSVDIAPGRVLAIVSERADVRTAMLRVLSGDTEDYVIGGDLVMDGRELVSRVGNATQAALHVARVDGPLDSRTRLRDVASPEVLQQVGLESSDERVNHLDEHQRLRAAFASALARHPRVVVVDLPYTSHAGSTYVTASELLHALAQDGNLTFVVCTDSVAVAADVADDVLVTLDGRAVEWGSVYDVTLRPAMPYVQELVRLTPSPHRALAEYQGFVELVRHQGCPWVLNCRAGVMHACSQEMPSMRSVGLGRTAACHLIGARHGA